MSLSSSSKDVTLQDTSDDNGLASSASTVSISQTPSASESSSTTTSQVEKEGEELTSKAMPSMQVDSASSPSDYEQARQKNLKRNLDELKNLGFDLTASLLSPIVAQQKKSNSKSKSRSKRRSSVPTEFLRRSTRSRSKRELFQNQDFSEKAVAKRQLQDKHEIEAVDIRLKLPADVLIDKLTKEAYLKSMEMKEARNRALDQAFESLEGKERAKIAAKRRRLKRIEKFEAEYKLLWLPKGSSCTMYDFICWLEGVFRN